MPFTPRARAILKLSLFADDQTTNTDASVFAVAVPPALTLSCVDALTLGLGDASPQPFLTAAALFMASDTLTIADTDTGAPSSAVVALTGTSDTLPGPYELAGALSA